MPDNSSPPKVSAAGPAPRINWLAAKAYWLALPVEKRTFKAVGERFGISAERVGQIAKREGWAEALAAVERAEDRQTLQTVMRAARSRADRLARTLEVYDRAADLALAGIPLTPEGAIDVASLGDARPKLESLLSSMPGLFKMAELAAGEATDRVAIADVQPVLIAFARIAVVRAPAEERGDVLRELEAASSGLISLPGGAE